ncbi:brg1-associated factor b [Peniophora sp. CONT]|nr:brg1-associated factor b [Peniophora sp. CONT]
MVQYGGDEVSALVVDIGASSVRAGYAGDDTPKAVVNSNYGFIAESTDGDAVMDDGSAGSASSSKMFIGQHGPTVWRANMQVGNPIQDGMINDFKPIPALMRHALQDVMHVDSTEHPVLVTEPAWNTPENRERMAEIMFEEFQVPAFYIANTAVLNAFAAGKGSALVIDIGKSTASVTPVVDGFVLRKGLVHSSLPQLVHASARNQLINQQPNHPPIQLLPHQLIAGKTPVAPNAPPMFQIRHDRTSQTTPSLLKYYEEREVDEWIQSVAGVLDQGWNDQLVNSRPAKQYEFPTGFNAYFGKDRFQVGEMWMGASRDVQTSNPGLPPALPQLLSKSLNALDADMRGVLLTNIVLTGGGSLFAGLSERLQSELQRQMPNVAIKMHAPGNTVERKYGAWLGGSILASLGTFHQLWISREEWQEHGKAIVGQRCK